MAVGPKIYKFSSQKNRQFLSNLDIFSFFTFTNTLHLKKTFEFVTYENSMATNMCLNLGLQFPSFFHKIVFLVSFRYRPFMGIEVVLGTVVLNTGVIHQNMHILLVPLLVYG